MNYGGIFDVEVKERRLEELEQAIQNPKVWEDPDKMQKLNQEKAGLDKTVADWRQMNQRIEDAQVLLEMAEEAEDEDSYQELVAELQQLQAKAEELELKSLLKEELDSNSCFLSINSGAGGTEAADWASILMRMYSRFADSEDYKTDIVSMTEGEEAGIKSVTLNIQGPYAYGYLKAENGVHRLVRISPFDSNARRHTSFASVFVWPEVDDNIEIEIRTEDLRIDTYRASGAGGQHVNTREQDGFSGSYHSRADGYCGSVSDGAKSVGQQRQSDEDASCRAI